MADKPPTERIAVLEVADQYEKGEILRLQIRDREREAQVIGLLKWRDDIESRNKYIAATLIFISAIFTGIGTFIHDIKASLKAIISWAAQ